jgi:hypothetical protein
VTRQKCTVRGSNPWCDKKPFSSEKSLCGPPSLLWNWFQGSFPGIKWLDCHAEHLPPSCVFRAWAGKTWHLLSKNKLLRLCPGRLGTLHWTVMKFIHYTNVNNRHDHISDRETTENFIFMLQCIVIDFFLNNQPDSLIIQIYSVIKLYMFRAPEQFHPDSAWKRLSKKLHETYQCRFYSRKLLMMDREGARNM